MSKKLSDKHRQNVGRASGKFTGLTSCDIFREIEKKFTFKYAAEAIEAIYSCSGFTWKVFATL